MAHEDQLHSAYYQMLNPLFDVMTFLPPLPPDDRRSELIQFTLEDFTVIREYFQYPSSETAEKPNETANLTEETIRQHLKTVTYDVVVNEEPEICVVCQDDFEEGAIVGVLHCKHHYHVDCITKWLLKSNDCPICRAIAFVDCQR